MDETPGDKKKKGASNAGKTFGHLALADLAGRLGLGRLRGRLGGGRLGLLGRRQVKWVRNLTDCGRRTQVGAAGADVGVLGLSGVALSCFCFGRGVKSSEVSVSSLSAKESTSRCSISSMRWASYLGQGPNFLDRRDCEGGRDDD